MSNMKRRSRMISFAFRTKADAASPLGRNAAKRGSAWWRAVTARGRELVL